MEPTQEEIERVREWERQRNIERSEQQQIDADRKFEEKKALLEGLVGARITSVELQRQEPGWATKRRSDDIGECKIVLENGDETIEMEYSDSAYAESTIHFNLVVVKGDERKWILG